MTTPDQPQGRDAARHGYGSVVGRHGGDGDGAGTMAHVHIPDSFTVAPSDLAAELNRQADKDAASARFLVFHLITGDRERLVAVFDGRSAYTRPPYEKLGRLLSILTAAPGQRGAVLLDRHIGAAWLTTVQEAFQFVSSMRT